MTGPHWTWQMGFNGLPMTRRQYYASVHGVQSLLQFAKGVRHNKPTTLVIFHQAPAGHNFPMDLLSSGSHI